MKYSKEDEGFYLIGMRDVYSGKMLSYKELQEVASKYEGVKVTSVFDKSLDEIMEIVKTRKSVDMEGFVINIDGHLFKLKVDDYVQMHRILSKLSAPSVIIKCLADGTFDDVLAKLPEAYRSDILILSDFILSHERDFLKTVDKYYEAAPKEDKKEFMLWVTNQVPRKYQGGVRNKYLNKPVEYLRRARGGNQSYQYIKMSEIDPNFEEKLTQIPKKN